MPMLISGRILTGVGASGVRNVISIILNATDELPQSEVAMLRSYLSLATTVGISSGAPLGGLLADCMGWRWFLQSSHA
ncbi:major facilitator superfamily domain-containing protein [Penicillium angulare]|uniref:Major facilitator superfamily domain-containing protein n=1 Tax=Penicillium angulare TaxID=116970 RepID=A0A9W9GDR9_9EURO|nr:major facilitator superfamily domain-containing protein [Penicillium angulare]